MALICLIFLGLFQISQLFAAREVLHHAAARAARAKTVGFRSWMVDKCVLVASIPNAGRLITPEFENQDEYLRQQVAALSPGPLWDTLLRAQPSSLQQAVEAVSIPEFLASENGFRARYILDYADWDTIRTPFLPAEDPAAGGLLIEMHVNQDYPLWVPGRVHRSFYSRDSVELSGVSILENHYPLYLDPDPAYY